MTMRLAFVTSAAEAALTADDHLAVAALAARGVTVAPAVWTDSTVNWAAFDAIVVRSPWDYCQAATAFHAWLDRVEATGIPILNPPSVLRWNSSKRYLQDLADRGAQVVPTAWAEPGDTSPLAAILATHGWTAAVVKPAVSNGATDTWRTSTATAATDEARFRELVARGTVMVQPFLTSIQTEGEWSLLFFNGVFSHAVRKVPQQGDFRVQTHHGATSAAEVPSEAMVATGERLVRMVSPLPVYARVDGCVEGGQFLLMELELIEPFLYFELGSGAAERFATALLETLGW